MAARGPKGLTSICGTAAPSDSRRLRKNQCGQDESYPTTRLMTYMLWLIALLPACSGTFADVAVDAAGQPFGDWAAADTVVALVVDPAACFICDDTVESWVQRTQTDSSGVMLILSRPPTRDEQIRFRIERVRPAAVLRGVPKRLHPERPHLLVLLSGRVVVDEPVSATTQRVDVGRFIDRK